MRPSRDETMMELAFVIAERSTCPRRGVGAVSVDARGRVLSIAHNGVAAGEPHCIDVLCDGVGFASGTGLDRCDAIHAEENLLLFCSDVMKIDTVYVTASPCARCIRMLLNTSARRIVYHELYDDAALTRWERVGRIADQLTREETEVPDITPSIGDAIEVKLPSLTTGGVQIVVAAVKAKANDGKWEIEINCDPPLKGKVDLNRYDWHPETSRWRIKRTVKDEPQHSSPSSSVIADQLARSIEERDRESR